MKELYYTVTRSAGLHARPANDLVKALKELPCAVRLTKGDREVDAKRLLGVMGLGVKCGEEIRLSFDGDGEDTAASYMEVFLKEHL